MKCTVLPLNLKLKREFIVTGGREWLKRNYLVILDDIGLGEAAGSVHYGLSPEEIERDIMRIRDMIDKSTDVPELLSTLENEICAPALCAYSSAWYDLASKIGEVSLHEHFGIPSPEAATTSVTVSVGDIEAWEDYLRDGYDCLKIKLSDGESWNEAAIGKIVSDSRTRYRIDANAGWNIDAALRMASRLPAERVELIEQPFAADDIDSWKRLRSRTSIPLFMDESIADTGDVTRVAKYVDGVNIKLQKSGRLDTAVAAMRAAMDNGLKVMMGCMIESSVGIATAYQLSGFADYLDLDSRLLLESDPFTGLDYDRNTMTLTHGFGHGISLA